MAMVSDSGVLGSLPARFGWPGSEVPFPVTTPFRMRPGLSRFDGELAQALAPDAGRDACAAAVEEAVAKQRLPVFAPGASVHPGSASINDLIAAARQVLSLPPPRLTSSADHADVAAQLLDVRRSLQDDIVLMTMPPATDDQPQPLLRASALAVAMPSGWDPQTKAGLDFLEIHAPVADAQTLRAAARPLSALLMREPWQRHVWTLSDSPALSAHPADKHDAPVHDWRLLWFRVERQISVPLPAAGGMLFLIRVYVAPLPQVLETEPGRAELLVSALQSMSPDVVAYKSLARYRALVLGALRS